jgi:hypothetical protein
VVPRRSAFTHIFLSVRSSDKSFELFLILFLATELNAAQMHGKAIVVMAGSAARKAGTCAVQFVPVIFVLGRVQ